MTLHNNKSLLELSQFWKLDGDTMKCRKCKRGLVASRDGEPMRHRTDCPNEHHQHPWKDLQLALEPF